MTRSSIYDRDLELLVQPIERIDFITKFWLITVVSDLVLLRLCYIFPPLIYQDNFVSSNLAGIIIGSILGFLIGTIGGLLQYLVFRRYFVREWIIAHAVSYIFYGAYIVLFLLWGIHLGGGQAYDVHPFWLAIYHLFFPFLLSASSLVLGCTQWLVFNTYLKQTNWWILFPLISGYVSYIGTLPFALLLWLILRKKLINPKRFLVYLLAVNGISLIFYASAIRELLFNSANQLLINFATIINYLESWLIFGDLLDGLGFFYSWITGTLIFNAIQAIAICYLRKQDRDTILSINSQSLFAVTTDSNNYWQTRSIIKRLEQKINRIWEEDLDTRSTLTYWLAVKNSGEIAACYPLNRVSQDNFSNTPLSQLIGETKLTEKSTAKLQVVFNYPGTAKIRSLSGIPLYIIAICFLSIITVLSLPIAHIIVLPLLMRWF